MKSFSDYLNKIKADDRLKESTRQYVVTALEGVQNVTTEESMSLKRGTVKRKRMAVAFSSLVACISIAVGGYYFYNMPMHYISVDINPSVEFGINILNRVVSQEAYNDDGSSVIASHRYTNMSLQNAMRTFIQEANMKGYISDDGNTAIVLTVESNQEKAAVELQTICSQEIEATLQLMHRSAVVYTARVNLELREQAQESGLSPGKYRLIRIMQSFDQEITFDEYKNTTISDILSETEELRLRYQIENQTNREPSKNEKPDASAEQNQNQNSQGVDSETEQPSDQDQIQSVDSQPPNEPNNDHSNQDSIPDKGTTEKRELQ